MQPHKGEIRRFKKVTKFVHHRSEGLTRRTDAGTHLQPRLDRARKNKA